MPSLISAAIPSLLFSVVLWVIVIAVESSQSGLKAACRCLGVLAFLSFLAMMLYPFVASLLLLTTCIFCLVIKARWRTFAISTAVVSLMSTTLPVWISMDALDKLAAMREQYPIESLEQRLAYEPAVTAETEAGITRVEPPLSSSVEVALAAQESEREGYYGRPYMLERLHEESYARFVAARGFGAIRMRVVRPYDLELPEVEPVPFPDLPPPAEYTPEENGSLAEAGEAPSGIDALEWNFETPSGKDRMAEFESLHSLGMQDFTDPERMGYVETRDRVIGFNAHRLTRPIEEIKQHRISAWQISRLELISLLKHETPVAYQSEHLPDMDELQDVPTRPLNEFETRSLPLLRTEQDIVFETGRNRIRMLGSLRAGTDCLRCHNVQRGDLLGAFTYILDRKQPHPEAPMGDEQVNLMTRGRRGLPSG